MDEIEQRLKDDAEAIEVSVSPQLRSRIDASLAGIEPLRPVDERPAGGGFRLWWASSLTGLAAALLIIAFVNRGGDEPIEIAPETRVNVTVPPDSDGGFVPPSLDVQTAEFTRPLEDEWVRLQSDLEKARQSVEKDLDFTF